MIKMNIKKGSGGAQAFLVGLCILIFAPMQLTGQNAATDDLQALKSLDETISNTQTLLEKYPGKDFAPNLMFQLSELYIKRATLEFQRAMLIYEEAEAKHEAGLLKNAPEIPEIDFSTTTKMSEELLEKFPTISFRDKVLYRLALCYSEESKKEEAARCYRLLTEASTEKEMLEESYFRLGEHHFDKKEYTDAVDYYSRLLESWDSPFFSMALYKLGWSYYSIENYQKAIGTFVYLVEDIVALNKSGQKSLEASKADLRREAIDYIAICFSEYGGPDKARKFLVAKKSKDYTPGVLESMARLYNERNFYGDAITTLQMLIEFYPNQVDAAFHHKKIVENYEKAGEADKADVERVKIVEQYGPGSEWLQQIAAGDKRDEVLNLVEGYIYDLGTETQQIAQDSKTIFDFEVAISHYNSYIKKFPKHERAHKVQFYLAECYFEIKNYDKAAKSYYELHLNYPESEFSETAAYNRVLAYNHLLSNEAEVDSADFFLFNFLGKGKKKEEVELFKAKNARQAQLIQAVNDFVVFHKESARASEVLINLGRIMFELKRFDLARQVYAEIIARPDEKRYGAQAHYMLAQCEFEQNNFEESEIWHRKVVELFPDSTRFLERANKMIASAQFKKAEAVLASGDSLAAASTFETIAGSAPDSAIAERALFMAANQFEVLDKIDKAIALYENFSFSFPRSDLVDESLLKAGRLAEDKGNLNQAASNYLKLHRQVRTSQYASRALFDAAKCYEVSERSDLARLYYDEYIKTYQDDPDRFLEAAFKKGEIAYKNRQKTAKAELEFVVTSYDRFQKEGKQAEAYFPAYAQFLHAELLFKTYNNIKLTGSLKKKLKSKRVFFQKVLKEYSTAAKYRVADWTTASSFRIGMTFQSFAEALLEAPQPKGVTAEQLQAYMAKLNEQVLPFKQKAVAAYETNIKNAEELGIENEWIEKTRKRLQQLNTELGLTSMDTELDSDS